MDQFVREPEPHRFIERFPDTGQDPPDIEADFFAVFKIVIYLETAFKDQLSRRAFDAPDKDPSSELSAAGIPT